MARELHRAGIATDAIEQTLTEVARAIGVDAQIFALPTNISISVGPDWNQRTVNMRLEPGRVSLRKIALLNEIYDALRRGKIDFPHAAELVAEVDKRWPGLPAWLQIPALGLIAVGVALILGGGGREIFVSALIGSCTGALGAIATKVDIVARLFDVVAAFLATLIVAIFVRVAGPTNVYVSIVAGIVVLLPGYSLTLALHELANDFLVAGVARLGKVLSVLLALGVGAFLGLAMFPSLLSSGNVAPHPVSAMWWIVASLCLSVGLSIDLDARLRDSAWVLGACFMALLATHVLSATPAHNVSAFLASFICGTVANLGARYLRVPQAIMLVPALLVLVPGSLSYESVLFAFQENINTALTLGTNAVFAAIQLVAGLLLSQLLFPASTLRVRGISGRTR
ncbi:MAG: threonine/serine exporter family protein [Candidatus Eremiobacteraeota bacterium]|nr:threonine/serine exporter family protein [Candidatus Eremiobacteraeota bacterium]